MADESNSHLWLGNVPIVTLYVGKPTKTFHLHRNLLCDASPVFKAAFLGTFQESERHTMDMGEDDALAFQVITHWLYTKTCELSEKDPDDADYTSRLATFKDWPHRIPTPESLADAGFSHKPSSESMDLVQCGQCSKTGLDSWKSRDSPVSEHLKRSPNCSFAQKAKEALKPTEIRAHDVHLSEKYFMRLAKVYAAAEKYGMIKLKNDLINILFRLKRASPHPKPPTYNVLSYVYNTTPARSPLRMLLVAWYTWHVHALWYVSEDAAKTLNDIPEFAADLACSNGWKMNSLVESSPLLGKPDFYHEDLPSGRELNDDIGIMNLSITDTSSKDDAAMVEAD